MPLLNKKAFVKKKPPHNIRPEEKVFYCTTTNEVFTDYDEFWGRLVLLNALVWTCELTGRPNLTYQEAFDSESKAKKSITTISQALVKPILYVTSLTRRGRVGDTTEDVFNFIRDRYFVGEEVEAIVNKHWYDSKVTRVIMPTPEEVAIYEKEIASSDEESEGEMELNKPKIEINDMKQMNGFHLGSDGGGDADDDDDEIMIIRDDHNLNNTSACSLDKSLNKSLTVNGDIDRIIPKPILLEPEEKDDYPPFATIKYEVKEIAPWDYKECKIHIVTWNQIRRSKSTFTKDKCKLFIKQCVRLCLDGYFTPKESLMLKHSIHKLKFTDLFVGNMPKFEVSKVKKLPATLIAAENKKKERKKRREEKKKLKEAENQDSPKQNTDGESKEVKKKKKKKNKEKDERDRKENGSPTAPTPVVTEVKKIGPRVLTEAEQEAARLEFERMREQRNEELARHKENYRLHMEKLKAERKKAKDVEKEEKRIMNLCIANWEAPKDDLLCEDHKDLPTPLEVQCRIPSNCFGDFLMVLEFVNSFASILELKDVYSHGITFDMLEHAVVEKEVAGVFNDIVQLLLGAIFSLQEEEDDEIGGDCSLDMAAMGVSGEPSDQSTAILLANQAATWSQQYQGTSLQKAPLDALTLTEILRLHILASGATNVANAMWRHMNRGGFKHTDDPGLGFKFSEPQIVKKLMTESIFDLTIGEKMKVLNVLILQILTYASVRDTIDECTDKLREMSNNWRLQKFAEVRKEKEEIAARKQKLKDDKVKLEKKLQKIALKNQPKVDAMICMNGEKPVEKINEEEVEAEKEESESEDEEDRKAREEREERNKEKRKAEFLKKEKNTMAQIRNLGKSVSQPPLGEDRAFRRYWLNDAIPALLLEDYEPLHGPCLEHPTPTLDTAPHPSGNKNLKDKIKQLAEKNFEYNLALEMQEKETEKNSSDKENEGTSPNKINDKGSANKKLLQVPNTNIPNGMLKTGSPLLVDLKFDMEDELDALLDLVSLVQEKAESEEMQKVFGLCSANPSTCEVHTVNHGRAMWSFYHKVEDYEQICQSLNSRGFREADLKEKLLLNRDKLIETFENCPAFKLNPSVEPDLTTSTIQKKSTRSTASITTASSNLNFPLGTPIEKILELTLRDMILEAEEKIFVGMLGCIKVPDREVWRVAIIEGHSICDNYQEVDFGGRNRIKEFKVECGIDDSDTNTISQDEDLLNSQECAATKNVIKQLAVAILHISQAVDQKYLKVPLAETEKILKQRTKMENRLKRQKQTKDKKEKDDAGDSSSSDEEEVKGDKNKKCTVTDNMLRMPIERWENSLMVCTSYSQLFLHLASLDNSITWSRSALNTRCKVCRRKSDPENMLLCDGCDKGFHMNCLKPKMKTVPSGDWFCEMCQPKEKPKSPRKNRTIYKEESEDESEEESEEEEEEEEEKEVNSEVCSACEMGGEIILCDTCPRSFHQECADLRKIPRGDWSCPLCKEEQENPRKSSRNSKKSPPESSKKRGTKRSLEETYISDFQRSKVETLLNQLANHSDSWPFKSPVYKTNIPDYHDKIKKPMDLRTVKKRFNSNKYENDTEFVADILLIFSNCRQYFNESDDEYKSAERLSKYFLNKVESLELDSGGLLDELRKPSKRRR